jgi:hypothetical protein
MQKPIPPEGLGLDPLVEGSGAEPGAEGNGLASVEASVGADGTRGRSVYRRAKFRIIHPIRR